MSTTARRAEETFRQILAAGLGSGFSLRLRNEPDARTLPAVVVSGEETGDVLAIKVAGRVAKAVTLTIECRINGANEVTSPAMLEQLAGSIEGLLANACTLASAWKAAVAGGDAPTIAAALAALTAAGGVLLTTDWRYLRFLDSAVNYTFESPVRIATLSFELHALTTS